MLLRLRDEYRIVVSPDRVVLARMKREISRRGPKRHVESVHEFECAPAAADSPWAGAIGALDDGLSGLSGRGARASVVLSNHFMRYALVPWSDALNDAKEELAYAQHSFAELYGRDAVDWDFRLSPGRGCEPKMASAVDARLLVALRETLARSGIALKSIQPHLMLACNACHGSLRNRSAWIALVEEGNLCLALLKKGHWSWVRSMRIGLRWQDELPRLLEREAFNAETEPGMEEVLLWAPGLEDAQSVPAGRWKVQNLRPASVPSLAAGAGDRFALYMSE